MALSTSDAAREDDLPLPPHEMRKLVGDPPLESWSNPDRAPVFGQVPAEAHDRFFDFGCGCGRTARRLLQMRRPPSRYLGVDLHEGMIDWCREHLAPRAPGFSFVHHPVYNALLLPDPSLPVVAPLPADDGAFTLAAATSVFTHLVEPQAEHYLDELERILDAEGWFVASWFLFDRAAFPVLQRYQHALYVNEVDPTNAVYYDRDWLIDALGRRGFVPTAVIPPKIRGYHWFVFATRERRGVKPASFPRDEAPVGDWPPPARAPTLQERLAQYDDLLQPARDLLAAQRYIADLERHLEMAKASQREAERYAIDLKAHLDAKDAS